MQDNPELTTPLAITFQPTEPEETNPEQVTASLEDILNSLDISEAQAAEQKVIDEMFRETLNSLDAIELTNDIEELGEAETEELLRVSEGEEEKEETMDQQPPINIIEAPFQCVDIRTKTEAARKASLKSIADRDAAKLARRRITPRRPTAPAASRNRPTANYTPPVTAASMHTEGEARPPKIARLMSLTIPAPEESPPHYTPATTYYAGDYNRPLPENRKRRFANQARQPSSGCYGPRFHADQVWDSLWFCQGRHCGEGHTSKSNTRCRKCCKRAYIFEKPVV